MKLSHYDLDDFCESSYFDEYRGKTLADRATIEPTEEFYTLKYPYFPPVSKTVTKNQERVRSQGVEDTSLASPATQDWYVFGSVNNKIHDDDHDGDHDKDSTYIFASLDSSDKGFVSQGEMKDMPAALLGYNIGASSINTAPLLPAQHFISMFASQQLDTNVFKPSLYPSHCSEDHAATISFDSSDLNANDHDLEVQDDVFPILESSSAMMIRDQHHQQSKTFLFQSTFVPMDMSELFLGSNGDDDENGPLDDIRHVTTSTVSFEDDSEEELAFCTDYAEDMSAISSSSPNATSSTVDLMSLDVNIWSSDVWVMLPSPLQDEYSSSISQDEFYHASSGTSEYPMTVVQPMGSHLMFDIGNGNKIIMSLQC